MTDLYDSIEPGQLALIRGHKGVYLYYASYGGGSAPLWAVEGQRYRFTTRSDWGYQRALCRRIAPDALMLELDDGVRIEVAIEEIARFDQHSGPNSVLRSTDMAFSFDDSEIELIPAGESAPSQRSLSLSDTAAEKYRWLRDSGADLPRDRALGALLGLALGDALGTTLEFSPRDAGPRVTDLVGGGPFDLEPGQWTDDTSMALCLAETLLERGEVSPRDLMGRFVAWWRNGHNSPTGRCFDIGATTRSALQLFLDSKEPLSGPTDPFSAGNGSLMRLAPVAIRWHRDAPSAREAARLQSATTHGAVQALEACALFAEILVEAISGASKEELLRPRPWEGDAAIAAIASGAWRDKERDDVASSGYVVHTLEAALWSTARAESLGDALLGAVNLGDDADTVGAVTGQLAGALWGASSAPAAWLEKLAWRARLEWLAIELFEAGERG